MTDISLLNVQPIEDMLRPVESERLAVLSSPESDPAALLPDYPFSEHPPLEWPIPPVQFIEDALRAHVVKGVSPRELIINLLHPFADAGRIRLEPGQGQQRPSYAIDVQDIGLSIPRSSVSNVAKKLHEYAQVLSGFAVGNRAPKGSPSFTLILPNSSRWSSPIIPASSPHILRQAYRALTGRSPESVMAPIEMSHEALIEHVRGARDLIRDELEGNPEERARAFQLIGAVRDLTSTASIILRQISKSSPFAQYTIKINPSENTCSIESSKDYENSHHATIQRAARYKALGEVMVATMHRHPVLRSLPEGVIIDLSGECSYLHVSMENKNLGHSNPERYFSVFDYDRLGELIGALRACFTPRTPQADRRWMVDIKGETRGSSHLDLTGATLTEALVRYTLSGQKQNRTMARITELLIDLMADEKGEKPTVEIFRLL